jgi:hypothetical protein
VVPVVDVLVVDVVLVVEVVLEDGPGAAVVDGVVTGGGVGEVAAGDETIDGTDGAGTVTQMHPSSWLNPVPDMLMP